jgi:hypothetical protein
MTKEEINRVNLNIREMSLITDGGFLSTKQGRVKQLIDGCLKVLPRGIDIPGRWR